MPSNEGGDAGTLHVQATIKYHLATDLAKNWKVIKHPKTEQTEAEEGLRQLFLTAMGNNIDDDSGAPLSEWGAQIINRELLVYLQGKSPHLMVFMNFSCNPIRKRAYNFPERNRHKMIRVQLKK